MKTANTHNPTRTFIHVVETFLSSSLLLSLNTSLNFRQQLIYRLIYLLLRVYFPHVIMSQVRVSNTEINRLAVAKTGKSWLVASERKYG